ncbi:xanthine dehydrogenase family protein molybdopterin-binding subunit [Gemmatimonas groenlandica]|uniref:Xanthine dehydrogenase family protein molybdopterin-binding subunit n=1 Tax=Gemmatimonas groenlandica TaxID=2732249 RepID=A0A6M4IXP9_9BACT|nr:molybdopterin cofactor-binding domain-containing protein [Gemmatimonas groenlandica]QJR36971.1 xanthine dehydrogenase family protein molybdopterin-binding subunit [Gemmatimonas groenlandica]
MKRRTFLLAGLGTGGALFLGWALLPPRQRLVGSTLPESGGTDTGGKAVALNGWLTIAPDDTITVVVPKAEMGQGTHTALAMLMAEELDCDWARVRVEHSPIDKIYGNVSALVEGLPFAPEADGTLVRGIRWMMAKTARELGVMMTGGSSSVRDCWMPMREAGASARASLIAAAAATWGVAASTCRTEQGAVIGTDGRRLRFGELASRAVSHRPREITLKAAADFAVVGKPMPRLDSTAKSNGTATYGIDASLPNMLYAAVLMSPFGATTAPSVTAAQMAQSRAMSGVRAVVSLPGSRYGDPPALAVVAESWWQAHKAAGALASATASGASAVSTVTVLQDIRDTLRNDDGMPLRFFGDAKKVLAAASRTVDATYEAPYLAHATMEPMNATVRVSNDGAELWTGTQVPGYARAAVAHVLGLDDERVTVHQHILGGGFGRRLDVDYVAQAAAIAKTAPGVPVQVIWSREDDMRHDFYRPATVSRLRAALDADGRVTAFVAHSAGQAPFKAYSKRVGFLLTQSGPDRTSSEGTWDQPYAFPALHASHSETDSAIPVGSWRSVGHSHHAFFVESFIDELAAVAKQDPAAYRATMLQSHPRALRVLQLATEKSGWGTPLAPAPDGRPRARGIALHAAFGSIVAEVAEVSVAADGRIRVHRVVAAVDCGLAVNPNIITQQIESGIIDGLSAALNGELVIEGGTPRQSNFHEYRLLRIDECPVIETHIVLSLDVPSGVGEPGLPPIAPAVANALFTLTGTRLRSLPLRMPSEASS